MTETIVAERSVDEEPFCFVRRDEPQLIFQRYIMVQWSISAGTLIFFVTFGTYPETWIGYNVLM